MNYKKRLTQKPKMSAQKLGTIALALVAALAYGAGFGSAYLLLR